MCRHINVSGKDYIFANDYRDNNKLRNSFNELTRKIFGFDFEQWYNGGYWQERFIPYSLIDGNTVVSNVSVNILDFMVLGEQKRYIQLGTVMTDITYRGQGLSRILMEKVLSDWQNKCNMIYLFANDRVLNFYSKFGFSKANEYKCTKIVTKKNLPCAVRKLDMSLENDKDLLYQTASHSIGLSKISMMDKANLIMFYCTYFMRDDVYYIDKYDTIVIAKYDEGTLFLQDIFSTNQILVDRVIDAMLNEQTNKVVLGFTPIDASSYEISLVKEEDTTLFIKTDNKAPFNSCQFMFPVLSHT